MVDLSEAFMTHSSFKEVLGNLLQLFDTAKDPVVAILALEGLFRIEVDVRSGQFKDGDWDKVRNFLRKWRCETSQQGKYSKRRRKVLRGLTIFKTLNVPLFIDTYGKKELLSSFGETQEILIDANTEICHVTHKEEKKSILKDKQLKPTNRKNIIEGCWFGLARNDNDEIIQESVYGTFSFKTTLFKLRVTKLRQGEIVCYKNEVNVILYADNNFGDDALDDETLKSKADFTGLKKPTEKYVKESNNDAYVKVSIFVPSRFLPLPDDSEFWEVFSKPVKVSHKPFCVRAMRSNSTCDELDV